MYPVVSFTISHPDGTMEPDRSFQCPSCFTFRVVSDSSNDFGVEKECGNNTEKFGSGFTTSDLYLEGFCFESRPGHQLN
jgi:hypothetical protein